MSREVDGLEALLAEREILRVLHNYCRAIDRGDVVLLRSVYHADAGEYHGLYQGTASAYIRHVADTLGLGGHVSTSHTLSNTRIDLDGDIARVESYVNAHHTLVSPDDGELVHEEVGLRYLDRFEKREGVWRIALRRAVFDWSRTDPVTDRTYFTRRPGSGYLHGRRDGDDPSYNEDLPSA